MQQVPISLQLLAVNLGPGFDKSLLGSWQAAADPLNWIYSEHGRCILIIGMKVWPMVRSARLDKHANNDSEEPRDLRHE